MLLAKVAADINRLLAEGRPNHQIAARFSLDRKIEAHGMYEQTYWSIACD